MSLTLGRIAYFDCFSGASGDMILGALLDAGLPLDALRDALGSLAIDCGNVAAERVLRAGVSATKFQVLGNEGQHPGGGHDHGHSHDRGRSAGHEHDHDDQHHHGRHGHDAAGRGRKNEAPHGHHSLKDIAHYIERSALSREGRDRALHLFERLAQAEASIHRTELDRVHLHEVGALDSIVDIVGAVFAMEWLGADRIAASPLNVGSGTVECAHGTFPVPAPATALLLRGVPVYAGTIAAELVTPTGALIVTEYAGEFGPLPAMRVEAIGYGAGDRDFPRSPNVLRLFVGDAAVAHAAERIVELQCEIDDMNPQLFGPLMDRLYGSGALEVFYAPVQMKKNRPGTLVTVLSRPEDREALAGVLFSDTTTIGVRYHETLRDRLDRETRTIDTPVGPIRFKIAHRAGRVLNAAPEFDDCARAAADRRISIKEVQAIASKAWLDSLEH